MTTQEQQLSPKQKLAAFVRSYAAAISSGDPLLQQYSANALSDYIELIEVTEPAGEEPEGELV